MIGIKAIKKVGIFLTLLLISSNSATAKVNYVSDLSNTVGHSLSEVSEPEIDSESFDQKTYPRRSLSRRKICDIDKKLDDVADNLDFLNGFVNLQALKADCELKKIESKLDVCCDNLTEDFNETWTILGGICSKIDNISMIFTGTIIMDLEGTFTVLETTLNEIRSCCDALMDDFDGTWTILGNICSKIDNISTPACDICGTFTVLNALENQLASCCDDLTEDFNETWTILDVINSRLDVLVSNTLDCDICDTFTVFESIRSEVVSCCDSLTEDFNETWTILAEINSKIDAISCSSAVTSTCDIAIISITQADVPYVIATSGCYCVAEDLIGTNTIIITIAADDVVLDLNCKTLSDAVVGVSILAGTENITVKNGYITAMTSTGVDATGAPVAAEIANLWFKDVQVSQCVATGFNFIACAKVVIQDCSSNNNIGSGIVTGFNLDQSNDFTFINCHADCNGELVGLASAAYGYHIRQTSNCTFKCCSANDGLNALSLFGFYLETATNGCRFDYCVANGNASGGGSVVRGFNLDPNTSHNVFYNCEASVNLGGASSRGFSVGTGTGNIFELCIASGNSSGASTAGFIFAGSTNSKVHQCTAIANSGSVSAVGFSCDAATTGCDVRENTALAHTGMGGIGFLDSTAGTNLIYANFACNNTTNYSIPAGFPIMHPNLAQEYDNVACDATPDSPTTRDLVISCCDSLTTDFQETWTLIGDTADTVPLTVFTDPNDVNNTTDYDVIQWLKALYIKMIDCCPPI